MAKKIINTLFKLGRGTLTQEAVEEVMPPAKSQKIHDTRNDNRSPQWYLDNFPRQSVLEMKVAKTIGIAYAQSTLCVLETLVPWHDISADGVIQKAYNIRDRSSWYRTSSNASTWGAWLTVH